MPAADPLPEVTDEHRRRAFALHAVQWPGVTFDEAMQVDIRRKLIEACASALRKDQARADRHPQPYRTTRSSADIPRAPRPCQRTSTLPAGTVDHKRAAAGDFDS